MFFFIYILLNLKKELNLYIKNVEFFIFIKLKIFIFNKIKLKKI